MSLNKIVLKYTKVIPEAFTPTKGSPKSAGYDLRSAYNYSIPARSSTLVDIGIKIELPEGTYGRIASRSSISLKHFVSINGVIDQDYRGVLKVIIFNHSDKTFEIKRGDRIAQIICEQIYHPDLVEVNELSETIRGEKGFGSTGLN